MTDRRTGTDDRAWLDDDPLAPAQGCITGIFTGLFVIAVIGLVIVASLGWTQ